MNWHIYDSERNTSNVIGEQLYANLSNAGADATDLDFLSNGFKWRRDVTGVMLQEQIMFTWRLQKTHL